MKRRPRRFAAVLLLPLLLAAAVWMPIPRLGDPGLERVVAAVHMRLPGWRVERATDTWEGGYAVVASCGEREIGFQVVHGHGLPPEDAWLQPNDWYARQRLSEVSDYAAFLIWRARPIFDRTLSCSMELAREAGFETTGTSTVPTSARNATLRRSDADLEPFRHRRVD